jgi:pilus assembly protein TadC
MMFLVLSPYILTSLLSLLFSAICAAWAAWVASDKYRNLDRDNRREIIIGLIVIALICGPVAVIAAYWSKPISSIEL